MSEEQKAIVQGADFLLNPKEEDIRAFCDKYEIDPILLGAQYRRFTMEDSTVRFSDVVYALWQQKTNNLPVGGPWHDLIPNKKGGKTLYANKNAAWYLITHDDRVDKDFPVRWGWKGSDGKVYNEKNPPTFLKANGNKIEVVIDWGLEAWLTVKLKGQNEPITMGDNYLNNFGYVRRQDGSIDDQAPWIKRAADMLVKQIARKFVERHMGPTLYFEPEIDVTSHFALPPATPRTIKDIEGLTLGQIGILQAYANRPGSTEAKTLAEIDEFLKRGGKIEDFIGMADRSIPTSFIGKELPLKMPLKPNGSDVTGTVSDAKPSAETSSVSAPRSKLEEETSPERTQATAAPPPARPESESEAEQRWLDI